MVQPTQLDPTEQDALVKQIGLAMLRAAPDDWDQITINYRAVGRYFEADGEIVYADERIAEWQVPAEITALFGRLRAGMYREGRGTWFNARYRLDHPSSYNLDYDRDEPEWRHPPPPQAFADDLATFPRTDDNVPEWLLRRASAPPLPPAQAPVPVPDPTAPRFRVARIFDGAGGNGRPIVNRRPIAEGERAELLDYLNSAPVAMQSRALDVDRLDPEARQVVPVAFHTDGTWIWPAAVNYYLHSYGVAPEPDLVDHIRRRGFQVPEVNEATLAAAAAFLGRTAPAPRPPMPAVPPVRRPADGPP
ncbi:MAG TPA: hypothetical protein VGX25_00280, partial [Actinophytocola sp.]|nr:hypothetical protein [Actinophytocola sp.]